MNNDVFWKQNSRCVQIWAADVLKPIWYHFNLFSINEKNNNIRPDLDLQQK